MKSFEQVLYTLNDSTFEDIALRIFYQQSERNKVYRDFIRFLGITPGAINSIDKIPFLPIAFFKSHTVITGDLLHPADTVFTSSGTTGSAPSRHIVPQLSFYHSNAKKGFEFFFGSLSDYHILALLPSYLEREGSSLISMVKYFMTESQSVEAGFYLNNDEQLLRKIKKLKGNHRKVLLLGVSFALLDFAEKFEVDLSHSILGINDLSMKSSLKGFM